MQLGETKAFAAAYLECRRLDTSGVQTEKRRFVLFARGTKVARPPTRRDAAAAAVAAAAAAAVAAADVAVNRARARLPSLAVANYGGHMAPSTARALVVALDV